MSHHKLEIESLTTTDGREVHRVRYGNIELAATKRAGCWEVDQITPGPFSAGLTEERAKALLLDLARLYRKHRAPAPAPRVECGVCCRVVGVVNGTRAIHTAEESAPGRRNRKCPGGGMRVSP